MLVAISKVLGQTLLTQRTSHDDPEDLEEFLAAYGTAEHSLAHYLERKVLEDAVNMAYRFSQSINKSILPLNDQAVAQTAAMGD